MSLVTHILQKRIEKETQDMRGLSSAHITIIQNMLKKDLGLDYTTFLLDATNLTLTISVSAKDGQKVYIKERLNTEYLFKMGVFLSVPEWQIRFESRPEKD